MQSLHLLQRGRERRPFNSNAGNSEASELRTSSIFFLFVSAFPYVTYEFGYLSYLSCLTDMPDWGSI